MRIIVLPAVALLLRLCGPVSPEERVFPAGRYIYTARVSAPASTQPAVFTGSLVVESVTPDSLVGRWEVSGYDPLLRDNYFNVVSYHVNARIGAGADSLAAVHRIRHRGDGRLQCGVALTRPGFWTEGECTLARQP